MNEKERQEKLLKMMEEEQDQSWSGVARPQAPDKGSRSTVGSAPKGDGGVSTVIPYKNKPALFAYYLGVFCILCPPILCLPAITLGVLGLKNVQATPAVKGTGHAIVGIVSGTVFLLLSILFLVGSLF
jgi:hypothetical protein